ncbi:response regulator [Hymenobacter sp. 15J16-1T3B]|uniref:hybrid sensor histidine kinase/response regulator n=1 Tax=Hymenobacter sp. 15J16-1T3B TaxID=2886941 RepID=UPI001D0F5B14|nr:hybrid sensor histidine kinase/response regulator [Hymenobacter sp. 15J16-1T3B]MCC3159190.1 response regulator [Hymenobacter sp. 15J16-1T3B]
MIRFCARFGLLLCLLWAGLLPARAQQRHWLKQFGPAEGFAPSFVYALHQDRQGYLWAATAEGLVRYDGTEFVTFTTKHGLAEDFVTRLYEEPRTGTLWVGHYQGGVSRWDGQRFHRAAKATRLPAGLKPQPGIPPADTARIGAYRRQFRLNSQEVADISCLVEDREGNAWLGTAGQGLWRHSDRHITLYPYQPPTFTVPTALGRDAVRALYGSALGRMHALRPDHSLVPLSQPLYMGEEPLHVPAPVTAFALAPTGSGATTHYRVATDGAGVWELTRLDGWQRVSRLPATLRATALAAMPDGSLWVGTALDGAYYLPADASQPAQHYTTANGLLHNTIFSLLGDRDGRVWFGTHDTGLAVWQRGRFAYHRFPSGALDVSALAQDSAGRVWIGTEGAGLFCFERGQLRQFTGAQGLPSMYCYALTRFRIGQTYHGVYAPGYSPDSIYPDQLLVVHRNGLSAYHPVQKRFVPLASPSNPLLRDLLPLVALDTRNLAVWAATRTGLICLSTADSSLFPRRTLAGLAVTRAEVDGEARRPGAIGTLAAGRHRVAFDFRGLSLSGAADVEYQYRLRGYHDAWSRPSRLAEAQFPGLDAGRYTLEVRARLRAGAPWSTPARVPFGVATPFWRTWWFAALALLTAAAGVWAVVRTREATLRRQKLQLERTVRERTQQLRQQKAHIEQINGDLVLARDAAEASRRAKAQFLANMSHEIRTPMNAVIGLTHLLQRTPTNAEQTEYLAAIQGSSQNLLTIINDILDSSKIEAGKMSLESVPFGLRGLLQRVARMFEFATASKGLQLRLELAPEVPVAVLGDPVRLNQVLVNLVGNAIKFTARGAVAVRVTAQPGAAAAGQWLVRFAVQDTGIGIAADKLDAIFEDFSQANTSTTRQFGGTGLGLSIARNLVELHGGQLWVESTVGVGSTFLFELPYAEAAPAELPSEAPAELTPFEPPLRVLVAEDNELNQLVARKTLEAWNVQVTVAANGRLAVEAATAAHFDAVLMDVQMPEMDGYEASRQLRLRFPDAAALPILGLTASALPEDRALALAAGMNDTLPKPFDPAELYASLARFTGRTAAATGPAPAAPAEPLEPACAPAATLGAPVDAPDWSLLEELAFGNEAFIAQIIDTFLRDVPPLLPQLQAATAAADAAATASLAHRIKGQLAYFGLPELHEQLDQLEQQAKRGALPPATAAQTARIAGRLQALFPLLQRRRDGAPA